MFTGIVQHLGEITHRDAVDFGARIVVDARRWSHRPSPGDSIAVNGCCLTVCAEPDPVNGRFAFDVIRQTLDVTTIGALVAGDRVNLESAVTPTTMLGGHIVQGHVDGLGVVRGVTRNESEWRVRIALDTELLDCVVERGSIAVDGVSLTLASVTEDAFEVALIPTTLAHTTLGRIETGHSVNIEVDYVAKTVVHWLRRQARGAPSPRVS